MPIRFRCPYCNKLLGIARRKAGTHTACPHCGYDITVPMDDGQKDQPGSDPVPPTPPVPVPAKLPPSAGATVPTAAPSAAPAKADQARPSETEPEGEVAQPPTLPEGESPLFEKNLDELLGHSVPGRASVSGERPKHRATSGMDAMSLGKPGGPVMLSPQKATVILVGVVVLLACAFAAGFFIASR